MRKGSLRVLPRLLSLLSALCSLLSMLCTEGINATDTA
jgi:hypothetical protein